MKISVIVPTFNEENSIKDCLESLEKQTEKDFEIIVVDDGSTDHTWDLLSTFHFSLFTFHLLQQEHLGPGIARNLGAKNAKGEILVFVDADMTFDKEFLKKLTEPIRSGKTIGTFSKEEFVLNKENVWSKCWNLNKQSLLFLFGKSKSYPIDRMHPEDYPDTQPVFRAILKKEFKKAGGFKPIGYIDDYTIADKLGVQAEAAPGAIFYHRNPETLSEIFTQARWIGKSEYKKRKIKNENIMRIITIIRYNPIFSLINGIAKAVKYSLPEFLVFKTVYDLAIEISVIGSYLGEQKYK